MLTSYDCTNDRLSNVRFVELKKRCIVHTLIWMQQALPTYSILWWFFLQRRFAMLEEWWISTSCPCATSYKKRASWLLAVGNNSDTLIKVQTVSPKEIRPETNIANTVKKIMSYANAVKQRVGPVNISEWRAEISNYCSPWRFMKSQTSTWRILRPIQMSHQWNIIFLCVSLTLETASSFPPSVDTSHTIAITSKYLFTSTHQAMIH